MDMSTIIAHGKSQWGRANKNKKVDPEEQAELEREALLKSINAPKSKITEEARMLAEMSQKMEAGDEMVGKVNNKEVDKIEPTPMIVLSDMTQNPISVESISQGNKKMNHKKFEKKPPKSRINGNYQEEDYDYDSDIAYDKPITKNRENVSEYISIESEIVNPDLKKITKATPLNVKEEHPDIKMIRNLNKVNKRLENSLNMIKFHEVEFVEGDFELIKGKPIIIKVPYPKSFSFTVQKIVSSGVKVGMEKNELLGRILNLCSVSNNFEAWINKLVSLRAEIMLKETN